MLALTVASLAACTWLMGGAATATDRLSLLTAWVCLVLLASTVGLGPWQALRSGRPMVNNSLRRDIGIWAAITGLLHLGIATAQVMQPAYFSAYITGSPAAPLPDWAGWVGNSGIVGGYVVGLIVLALLVLSNDWSLHQLGIDRWKRLQRGATNAFFATVAHGAAFQVIERRVSGWLPALLVVATAIIVLRRRARGAVAARALSSGDDFGS